MVYSKNTANGFFIQIINLEMTRGLNIQLFSSLASLAAISSFPFPGGETEQSSKQEYPWGEPKIGESGWGEKESPAVKPKHFT